MNDNEPKQAIIRLSIKDAFNGQMYTINLTEVAWDSLVQQVEQSRAAQRKKALGRLDA